MQLLVVILLCKYIDYFRYSKLNDNSNDLLFKKSITVKEVARCVCVYSNVELMQVAFFSHSPSYATNSIVCELSLWNLKVVDFYLCFCVGTNNLNTHTLTHIQRPCTPFIKIHNTNILWKKYARINFCMSKTINRRG